MCYQIRTVSEDTSGGGGGGGGESASGCLASCHDGVWNTGGGGADLLLVLGAQLVLGKVVATGGYFVEIATMTKELVEAIVLGTLVRLLVLQQVRGQVDEYAARTRLIVRRADVPSSNNNNNNNKDN